SSYIVVRNVLLPISQQQITCVGWNVSTAFNKYRKNWYTPFVGTPFSFFMKLPRIDVAKNPLNKRAIPSTNKIDCFNLFHVLYCIFFIICFNSFSLLAKIFMSKGSSNTARLFNTYSLISC